MALKKIKKLGKGNQVDLATKLKVGDKVMIISGGNKKKAKNIISKTGKILRFTSNKQRVVVEGLNYVKRHKRAMASDEQQGILTKEAPVHISNVMFFSDEEKRPVRLKAKVLDDGTKVRGYIKPGTTEFKQLDS